MFRHQDFFLRGLETETFLKMATTKVKVQLYIFIIVFFVIPGSKNVYIDTKIIFPSDLETEILRHVYSGGHFGKWPPLISRVKFGMAL